MLSINLITLPPRWREMVGGGGLLPDTDELVFIARSQTAALPGTAEISLGYLDTDPDHGLRFWDSVAGELVTDVVAWGHRNPVSLRS